MSDYLNNDTSHCCDNERCLGECLDTARDYRDPPGPDLSVIGSSGK